MAQEAVERRFEQLDRDKDGSVTPDELPAKTVFRRLDLDRNGAITESEAMDAVRQGGTRRSPRAPSPKCGAPTRRIRPHLRCTHAARAADPRGSKNRATG
jgi:hypothetical protein